MKTSPNAPTEAVPAASEASGAAAPSRLVGLDRLRGLAVLLMVLDHVLFVVEPSSLLRLTVTRASLPLFCVVAGSLWRPGWRARYWHLTLAGCAATVIGLPFMPTPDVLFVLLWSLGLLHAYRRWPVPVLCIAAIQATTWPLFRHPLLGGYELGVVLVLLVAGLDLVGAQRLHAVGARLPRVFEVPGRYPLTFYVGHLFPLLFLAFLVDYRPLWLF